MALLRPAALTEVFPVDLWWYCVPTASDPSLVMEELFANPEGLLRSASVHDYGFFSCTKASPLSNVQPFRYPVPAVKYVAKPNHPR